MSTMMMKLHANGPAVRMGTSRRPDSIPKTARPLHRHAAHAGCSCTRCRGRPTTGISTKLSATGNGVVAAPTELNTVEAQSDLHLRQASITKHFPSALGVDDFIARVEVALSGFGFTGDNSIAMTCLCRDEVTIPLKDKIEAVFGSSFNTNGLGGVLTCGVTGMGAGLSHSPVSGGKEHYVFFAFPHIAINSTGEVGAITRPGRPVKSCACGALQKALIELRKEGYEDNCKVPGVHDPLDPEYSILKQRLARRARYEKVSPSSLDLVSITHLADRVIANDLEFLAERAVDTARANYAVITGVQIHNWATDLDPESNGEAKVPSLEFVAPTKCYVVVDGQKAHIDLSKVPALSPRQLQLMAAASISGQKPGADDISIARTAAGTLKEIPITYLTQRLGVTRDPEDLAVIPAHTLPWTANIVAGEGQGGFERDASAPNMGDSDYTSFQVFTGPSPSKDAVIEATPAAVTALLSEIQALSSRVVDLEKKDGAKVKA